MPGVTPTKSGHNARRWCGHTCVVYAINPGIHARPIFTMAHVYPVSTTSHGRTRTDENGPRSFQLVHRAPRLHGPFCVSSRAFVVASRVCLWTRIVSRRPRGILRGGAPRHCLLNRLSITVFLSNEDGDKLQVRARASTRSTKIGLPRPIFPRAVFQPFCG